MNIKVTVDIIVCCPKKQSILFIKRKNDPFKDYFALPGGYVETNEDLLHAAQRELKEETGIEAGDLKQLCAVGNPDRDPRGYTVTIVYYILLEDTIEVKAASDAMSAKWIDLKEIPVLAFDHNEIVQYFLEEL